MTSLVKRNLWINTFVLIGIFGLGLACNLSKVSIADPTPTVAVVEEQTTATESPLPTLEEPTSTQQVTSTPSSTESPIPSPTERLEPSPVVEPTETFEGVIWRQWASGVVYCSSEYDSPDKGANQILGEPDTLECGDASTAWASAEASSEEMINIVFGADVHPLELNIYQSNNPNQVVRVQVLDWDSNTTDVYTGSPESIDTCPYVLTIPLDLGPDSVIYEVKIYLDQSGLSGSERNQLDAVELVGWIEYNNSLLNPNTLLGVSPYELSPGQFYIEVKDDAEEAIAVLQGGEVIHESSASSVAVNLFATDENDHAYTITLYLPKDIGIGIHELQPNMFTGEEIIPSSSLLIDDQFYYGIGGSINIFDNTNGKITGWLSFTASIADETLDETIYVTGALMEIPLE